MPRLPPVQTLWIGERLTALERLSLASFLHHGHPVHLYVYGPVDGVPRGVRRCDAAAIVPADRIFRYGPEANGGAGSVAGFANLFRYALLAERGGWWADTDVVCLRPLDLTAPHCFAWQDATRINVAVLRMPRGSPLAIALRDRAVAMGTQLPWGATGPSLMTETVTALGLGAHALPSRAFYPVHYSDADRLYAADADGALWRRLDGAYTLHFWNELARRAGLDKDGPFPASSVYERLKREVTAPRDWRSRLRRALTF